MEVTEVHNFQTTSTFFLLLHGLPLFSFYLVDEVKSLLGLIVELLPLHSFNGLVSH